MSYTANIRGSKLFREAIRILDRKLDALENGEFSEQEITASQCRALVEIGRAETISLVELAEISGLDSSTMSRTVDSLVTRGLAVRKPDTDDRRYISIFLSEEGKKLFDDIEDSLDAQYDDIFARVPETKRKDILDDLIIIIEALSGGESPVA